MADSGYPDAVPGEEARVSGQRQGSQVQGQRRGNQNQPC
jgi:hypothetical protein